MTVSGRAPQFSATKLPFCAGSIGCSSVGDDLCRCPSRRRQHIDIGVGDVFQVWRSRSMAGVWRSAASSERPRPRGAAPGSPDEPPFLLGAPGAWTRRRRQRLGDEVIGAVLDRREPPSVMSPFLYKDHRAGPDRGARTCGKRASPSMPGMRISLMTTPAKSGGKFGERLRRRQRTRR